MTFFRGIAGAIIIPCITLLFSAWMIADSHGLGRSTADMTLAYETVKGCALGVVNMSGAECGADPYLAWLMVASIGVAAAGVVLVIAFQILALVFGVHRTLLAGVFPPFAFKSLALVGLLGVAQFALIAGCLYFFSQNWLGGDMLWMAGAVAIAGLIASWGVLKTLWRFFRNPPLFVLGRPVSLFELPRLSLVLKSISKDLKAKMPENIVLGMEPTFFVTAAPIQTPYTAKPLKGRTLFLSLPLMRILSLEELKAVIGHELGHFAGNDVAYSSRFAPVYRGLLSASQSFGEESNWLTKLLGAPTRAVLSSMTSAFDRRTAAISRGREIRADAAGAKASSPEDLGYSLLKSSVGGALWHSEITDLVERARHGRFSRNVSLNFAERHKFDIDRDKLAPRLALAMQEHQPHPTDTHPSTEDRMTSLGLAPESLLEDARVAERFFDVEPAITRLDDHAPIEEDLTGVYYLVHEDQWKQAAENYEQDSNDLFQQVCADFLAMMVMADGEADDREIETAEKEMLKHLNTVDSLMFRERCRHPEDLPELNRLIDFANRLFTPDGAARMMKVLHAVAAADDEIHPEEDKLLKILDETFIGSIEDEED